MKVRLGFVSNSSSSSFLIGFQKSPELKDWINAMGGETGASRAGIMCPACAGKVLFALNDGSANLSKFGDEADVHELGDERREAISGWMFFDIDKAKMDRILACEHIYEGSLSMHDDILLPAIEEVAHDPNLMVWLGND